MDPMGIVYIYIYILGSFGEYDGLHSPKLTWNLKMSPWKMKYIYKASILGVYVSFHIIFLSCGFFSSVFCSSRNSTADSNRYSMIKCSRLPMSMSRHGTVHKDLDEIILPKISGTQNGGIRKPIIIPAVWIRLM